MWACVSGGLHNIMKGGNAVNEGVNLRRGVHFYWLFMVTKWGLNIEHCVMK